MEINKYRKLRRIARRKKRRQKMSKSIFEKLFILIFFKKFLNKLFFYLGILLLVSKLSFNAGVIQNQISLNDKQTIHINKLTIPLINSTKQIIFYENI